jgi:lysophospholipase L1-like esterase
LKRTNSSPEHKLVVLGDSISQGFQNGGIYRTDINFPSFLRDCWDPVPDFDQPLFTAQAGIPLNLEVLARGLSDEYGNSIEWNEYLPAITHLYSTLKRVKKYWEGKIKPLQRQRDKPYHNQSVWGFSMNDAWMITEEKSREHIETQPDTYSIFDMLPDHAMYTTARLVLNPSFGEKFRNHTQIDNVQYLQNHGGIENLIVTMGHNNIIGAASDLKFILSEEEDLDNFPSERDYTVYRPEHFEQEYRKLAEKVSHIGAERVITQTMPYVTIPPVTRGVNADKSRKGHTGYFDYYTHFWVWDEDFNPDTHPHLTKEEAISLDQYVDEYNNIIREIADEYGWITVPLNRYVSGIARRRLGGDIRIPYPKDFCKAMKRNPDTKHLVEDRKNPKLSTDYLRIDKEDGKVYKGGIFSLDGIHPTTIGYGLIAHLYRETMEKHGINFDKPLDWDHIIENDTLVTDPPYLLVELRHLLRFLSLERQQKLSIVGNGLLNQLMSIFSHHNKEDQ